MKKVISFLLALTFAFSMTPMGHGEGQPAEPKLETAIVQADGIPAILFFLNREEQVTVTKKLDEKNSLVETEHGSGIIETQLLRFPWEPEYESWIGYARSGAALHKDYELHSEPLKTLTLNTKVLVLDEFEDCYLVSLDLELPPEEETANQAAEEEKETRIGYVEKSKISKTIIEEYRGWDGGNAAPSSGSRQDGGDISMAYYGLNLLSNAPTEPEKVGEALVRVDGAKLILMYFLQGDTVQLVEEEGLVPEIEGYLIIYVDGTYAYIPEGWILLEGEEPFESWKGYSAPGCMLYDNYLLRGEAVKTLVMNTKVNVLWDNGTVSLVQLEDENNTIGFVNSSELRTSPVPTGDYSGSANPGNGGSQDWTPPVL